MRPILHAKFGDPLGKHSCASDEVPRASPSPQMRNNSVEEFEAALTKARAAWRAGRGPTRTAAGKRPYRAASIEHVAEAGRLGRSINDATLTGDD
jgi:hypothetical protein